MDDVSPRDLRKRIERTRKSNGILAVFVTSPQCHLPCVGEENALKQLEETLPKNVEIVKLDADQYASSLKEFSLQPVYPSLRIYRNGDIQPFQDKAISSKTVTQIVGKRENAGEFILQTMKVAGISFPRSRKK